MNNTFKLLNKKRIDFKIKNLNKKLQKSELLFKRIFLKFSIIAFNCDKILAESPKPYTYSTKLRFRHFFNQEGRLLKKYNYERERQKILENQLNNLNNLKIKY